MNADRILVIKMSSLGDLFHALPAVHSLKAGLGCIVDWVVQEEYADVVRCFTDVDRVIPFFRRNFPGNAGRFLSQLREHEYDHVIDLQGLLKSAVVARLARAGRRIGPSFHREASRLFYTSIAGKRNKDRHAVEENLDIIGHLGLEVMKPEFPVKFPDRRVDAPAPRIGLMPVSRWETKNWPIKSFTAAARMLREKAAASLFVLGGRDDAAVCRQIEKELGSPVENQAGRISLPELGGLLSKMDLVISNDTGPMHIAAALNVPVLAIFGATDPRRTGPYGARHRVVSASLPCQPCFDRKCRFGAPRCLLETAPETVANTALEMLIKTREKI